jgi:hypothetical protein
MDRYSFILKIKKEIILMNFFPTSYHTIFRTSVNFYESEGAKSVWTCEPVNLNPSMYNKHFL